jgi:hypothetical protein
MYKSRTRHRRRSIDWSGYLVGVLCLRAGIWRPLWKFSSGISYDFFTLCRHGIKDPDACFRRTLVFLSGSHQID